jgi:hypothetical protein
MDVSRRGAAVGTTLLLSSIVMTSQSPQQQLPHLKYASRRPSGEIAGSRSLAGAFAGVTTRGSPP